MRKNISLPSLEFVVSPFDVSGNMDTVTQNLSAALSSSDVTLLSFLSDTSPWNSVLQEIACTYFQKEKAKETSSHLLAFVTQLPHTGRLALAADQLNLSGTAIYLTPSGFYLTTFASRQLQTQYFTWNNLALSTTLSSHEMKILAMAWILCSSSTVSSMLEAVDEARKAIRSEKLEVRNGGGGA